MDFTLDIGPHSSNRGNGLSPFEANGRRTALLRDWDGHQLDMPPDG